MTPPRMFPENLRSASTRCYFQTAEDGAVAYNNYIIENNLEGFILNEIPQEYLEKGITNEKVN